MDRTLYSFRFGTAEFDESRFELKVAGLPVEVERRAMEVLSYLLRHAGEVVTKEELLREVWAGRITVDKVLPNAITKLRRALGEENARRITTQARIGYRLDGTVSRTAVGRHAGGSIELGAGQAVPGRPSFLLRRALGVHRGSEVWLAEHAKTREKRVYKFALDAERLRGLQRETTLLRVLHDSLADSRRFVGLVDWNFAEAPYFVECDYGGDNLLDWAATSLAALDVAQRIALFLQVVEAVDAAHSVGVLHKDIKPSNILVSDGPDGPSLRLTDFGSGRMLEPDRLQALGITRQGLTVTEDVATDAYSGTPLYLAPEVFAGQAPTVRSDVYALGILLYQLLTSRLREPMASSWEADIDDPLLREDIRLATDGDPERRLASAAALGDRLRRLDQRRAMLRESAAAEAEAARAREALVRSRVRRPFVLALLAALTLGLALALWLEQGAQRARAKAEAELARAAAMLQFVEEDLVSRANPLILGKGPEATIKDVLIAARDRLDTRFADQPLTGAALRQSFATLFDTLDLWAEAESEARLALAVYERETGADSDGAREARAMLARMLSRQSRFAEASRELERLAAPAAPGGELQRRYLLALATSTYQLARADFAAAVPELREALAAYDALRPAGGMQRDSLTLELVVALGLSGRLAESVAVYEDFVAALATRAEDTTLLRALAQLAVARSLSLGGDHARAEALLREAREVVVAQLGSEHVRHLGLLNELMGVYFRQADWDRALPIARDLHQRMRAKHGDAQSMSWTTLGNLGRTLYEAGRTAEASSTLREAHTRLAALVGEDNPQVQDIAFALASSELALGRRESARSLLAGLDPLQLEKGRATGSWAASVSLLRGMLAAADGEGAAARRALQQGLAQFGDGGGYTHRRLLADAQAALAALPAAAD